MASSKIKSKRLKINDMKPGDLFLVKDYWRVFWIQEDTLIIVNIITNKFTIENGGEIVISNYNASLKKVGKNNPWRVIK